MERIARSKTGLMGKTAKKGEVKSENKQNNICVLIKNTQIQTITKGDPIIILTKALGSVKCKRVIG